MTSAPQRQAERAGHQLARIVERQADGAVGIRGIVRDRRRR